MKIQFKTLQQQVIYIYPFVICLRQSHYIALELTAQAGLELPVILLPQSPQCWDHNCAPTWSSICRFVSFAVLGTEPMASDMVGQHSVTEPHSLLFLFEPGSHPITQPGLEFSMQPKLASNSQKSSSFDIPTVINARTSHHVWLSWLVCCQCCYSVLGIKPRPQDMLSKHSGP